MPAHPESIDLAVVVTSAADDKLASDLALYDVADVLAVVDVFALASGGSDRQVRAIVDNIEDRVAGTFDLRPLRREGSPESGWVLLDYGDVVAHVFTTEQRGFYDLDRLFSDVPSHDPHTGAPTREVGADPSVPSVPAGADLVVAVPPDHGHDESVEDDRANPRALDGEPAADRPGTGPVAAPDASSTIAGS